MSRFFNNSTPVPPNTRIPAAPDSRHLAMPAPVSHMVTHSDRLTRLAAVRKLTGMYKNWFLDYASYVILERAVPHLEDGLKPVQRRILHAMKVVEDGRYNKVANIVGQTMQYHPHGDASIKDALVQLGQKNLLIDMQGNWGNIFTGDEPRRDVISRRGCRSSRWMWSTTARRPSGCSHTTAARRSP